MSRQLTLDIEAAPTTDEPQFDDASVWSPFAIAVSFRRAAESMPETAVFVRQDGTADAERKLLAAMANWIHDRRPVDVLCTFNGGEFRADADGFDLPILAHRIECELQAHDDALADYVRAALDAPHRDLFAEIVDGQADDVKWPSLGESLSERGLAKATPKLDGEDITGADMPRFGREILAGDGLSHRERRVLREYASSDVRPLHPLADALDEEREVKA